jgi:N6-adenosine-specific RNA methylase IME4
MQIQIDAEFKALIPPLAPDELAQLEANIIKDGCRDPLVTWQGILIDGHNRFEICTRNGLPFQTVEMAFDNREAAMDWMDANQLGRRNLTNDQRSILRGRRYNRTKKANDGSRGNQYTMAKEEVAVAKTAETIAKQHGVSERTIRSDGKKAEAIEKLALTNPDAAKAVTDGIKRFNEVRREIKLEEVKESVALPDAKYRVIYSDPPWKYGDQLTEDYGSIKFHYPSMTISELCDLPVKEMVDDDAVLFLWVTSPLLFECEPIIKAWGFKYKTSFVWDKIKHNMGHYNSVRHEFLLICTRGSCTPDEKQLFDSVQSIERTQHSAKPEEFRNIINTLYPHGKKLEMFARKEAPEGWDNWGNQSL